MAQVQPSKESIDEVQVVDEAELRAALLLKGVTPAQAEAAARLLVSSSWACTYKANGVVVTNTAKLHLEVSATMDGVMHKFTGDAEGIFPPTTSPLLRGKLHTKDVQALCTRGNVFTFNAKSCGFFAAFFDDNWVPLGKLIAAPIAIIDRAGGPGSGSWV